MHVHMCECVCVRVSQSWKLFEYCTAGAFSHKKSFSSPKAKNRCHTIHQPPQIATILEEFEISMHIECALVAV